jgi:hypothetical protein
VRRTRWDNWIEQERFAVPDPVMERDSRVGVADDDRALVDDRVSTVVYLASIPVERGEPSGSCEDVRVTTNDGANARMSRVGDLSCRGDSRQEGVSGNGIQNGLAEPRFFERRGELGAGRCAAPGSHDRVWRMVCGRASLARGGIARESGKTDTNQAQGYESLAHRVQVCSLAPRMSTDRRSFSRAWDLIVVARLAPSYVFASSVGSLKEVFVHEECKLDLVGSSRADVA